MNSYPRYFTASKKYEGASHENEEVCCICKERFFRTSAHIYRRTSKGKELFFCKYSCMRQYDKEHERKRESQEEHDKREVERIRKNKRLWKQKRRESEAAKNAERTADDT